MSLFGGGNKTNTGSLFGGGNTSNNSGGGGLFGGSSTTNTNSGGMFGGANKISSGGLFGGTNTNTTSGGSGGLFGGSNTNSNNRFGNFQSGGHNDAQVKTILESFNNAISGKNLSTKFKMPIYILARDRGSAQRMNSNFQVLFKTREYAHYW